MTIEEMLEERWEYATRGVDAADVAVLGGGAAVAAAVGLGPLVIAELPFALLRALVPLPQATTGSFAIGFHIELTVIPAPPFLAPLPTLFGGMFIPDPGAALVRVALESVGLSPSGTSREVVAWGQLAAKACGDEAKGMHIPLAAGSPQTVNGEAKAMFGSACVDIGGHHAVRLGELLNGCGVPVRFPNTRVLAFPMGRPIMTGGQSVLDLAAAVAITAGDVMEGFVLLAGAGLGFDPTSPLFDFVKTFAGGMTETLVASGVSSPAELAEIAAVEAIDAAIEVALP